MKRSNLSQLVLLGLMGALMAPMTKADPVYKRTEVKFNQPVEIPGMVLLPGTYVMKLLDPYMDGVDRNIVRFYNPQESHMYAMVFAVPDYRLRTTDHTVIKFEERAHNAPPAIKEWFPAGDNWGEEFVYPKVKPIAASVTPAAPPQLQPRPTAITPAPAAKPLASAPVAQAQPKQPVEIAQAQPVAATSQPAAPATEQKSEQKKELPKTASGLPMAALLGGMLVLAGAILRRITA